MKRFIFLFFLDLILSACTGASGPGAFRCGQGLCVRLQVQELVNLNTPAVVTITTQSDEQIPGLEIALLVYPPSVSIENGQQWTVNAPARQALNFTRNLRFHEEGYYHLIVQAHDRRLGGTVDDDLTIQITRTGATVYYSGTPIPITPGPAPTLPRGLVPATPPPTPTRRPYP